MAHRVLLVDNDSRGLAESTRALAADRYLVAVASGYEEARQRLELAAPDLLVVDVRLGSHNGLQLVLRARSEHPGMAAVVTHAYPDPVLEREARNAGAVFLVKPVDTELLLQTARELLAGRPPAPSTEVPRRWPRKPVSVGGVLGSRRVRVIDLSYGGLCVEVSEVPDPGWTQGDQLTLSAVGRVPVRMVWSKPASKTGRERWFCGAEVLIASRPRKTRNWRCFVDSLN